ncbi:hypothetical protein N7G274_007916 [Stereocaulon virgatum]|uniref:Uncharacterized protein n=1 Tax=Stereocaulon virgatum TaxID=373712 RepID=A0ABR4A7E8_9LECA
MAGTLKRASIRYERFMALIKRNPEPTLVPTLDIDLVRQTQQCSPTSYLACCTKLAGRLFKNDHALEGEVLKNNFAETSSLYEIESRKSTIPVCVGIVKR